MKSIKEYINESLLDDEDDLIENNDALIRGFIEQNYVTSGPYTIKDGVVDVNGYVYLKNVKTESLTNGLFKFGTIKGYFKCEYSLITSLKGAPKDVWGYFDCCNCRNLKTLEGAPENVSGDFDCSFCRNLMSLEGAPKVVGQNFMCDHCRNLMSLEGAPKVVGQNFMCDHCRNLMSLEGAPEKVGGSFNCMRCNSLSSYKGIPKGVTVIK